MKNTRRSSRFAILAICLIVLGASAYATTAGAAADGPIVHVVQWGETLSAVSRRYGVSIQELYRLNDIAKNGWIYTGQRLTIPQLVGDPAPAPSTSIRLTGVPLTRQRQSLTCEEAAASMASRGRFSEASLVSVMPRSANPFEGIRGRTNARKLGTLTDYGTYAQGLKRGLDRLGVASRILYRQSYADFRSDIVSELRRGKPVVWWTTFRQIRQSPVSILMPDKRSVTLIRWEHTVVIVGMTDTGFLTHDPFDATVRFVSFADHQRASGYFDNMALVID